MRISTKWGFLQETSSAWAVAPCSTDLDPRDPCQVPVLFLVSTPIPDWARAKPAHDRLMTSPSSGDRPGGHGGTAAHAESTRPRSTARTAPIALAGRVTPRKRPLSFAGAPRRRATRRHGRSRAPGVHSAAAGCLPVDGKPLAARRTRASVAAWAPGA
ncbi:hypothetical protein PAHAL_5G258200 [Panicum hallii]|jgi:hypothetical protein|uniref:Uncharacterized protein n=1 Tax=Panicum hallii TaxID=206008 RepID=A0A270R550_9POAL|nr:hypothetical protein PAHAL_5G258200 [Panicum hallii]